jgi:hypothetical protein
MRKLPLSILIGLFFLTGCAAQAATAETPTLPAATAAKIPTATAVPPTPTPEPTPTPAPIAVPLYYKSWQDKGFAQVCVEAEISEPEGAGQTDYIVPAVSDLLEAMGMNVVPAEDVCEALFVVSGNLKGKSANYSGGGADCKSYTGADFKGELSMRNPADGKKWLSVPLRGMRETSQFTQSCKTEASAPFSSVWPKALIEGFSKIYGFKALEGAITVPILRFEVSQVLQEGKFSPEETLPVLMKSLQSNDDGLIKASLVAIAEYREDAAPAVPLLIPLLTHSDKWLATLAADCLRMIGPGAEAAIPALLVAIEDPDIQLAPQAAFALGTIGRADDAVLAALMRHVDDPDYSMSMFVQTSLERLTGEKFTKPGEWLNWWSHRPKTAL